MTSGPWLLIRYTGYSNFIRSILVLNYSIDLTAARVSYSFLNIYMLWITVWYEAQPFVASLFLVGWYETASSQHKEKSLAAPALGPDVEESCSCKHLLS